jgi:NAD-dependent SIR2 family protein deacetylase
MAAARANAAHRGLARLEEGGVVVGLITQNVDGLHQAGGSRRILELHGSLAYVVCLTCGRRVPREVVQRRIEDRNSGWIAQAAAPGMDGRGPESAPDGDADILDELHRDFVVPECDACGGVLKPDVVFFGENVPRPRVDEAWRLVDSADLLLVVGSSLTVYSGRRFIYGAQERGMPIGVANLGPTRADEVASAKVEGRLGEVIPRLAEALLSG